VDKELLAITGVGTQRPTGPLSDEAAGYYLGIHYPVEVSRGYVSAGKWVFGGPAQYTEDLGGCERMLSNHLRLGITEEQRFRFATLIRLAADDAEMSNDPEFNLR
jgi:hypothetical protein